MEKIVRSSGVNYDRDKLWIVRLQNAQLFTWTYRKYAKVRQVRPQGNPDIHSLCTI